MQIISSDVLKNLGTNKTPISGVVMIKSYSIGLTKRGDEFFNGEIQSGVVVPFKSWNNSSAFTKLKSGEYSGQVMYISGEVNEYQGQKSIIVNSIAEPDEEFGTELFMPIKYNMDAYWNGLRTQFEYKTSEKIHAIANEVLFENAEVAERFKVEQAASSHHDNCRSGLEAHTYKVMRLMDTIIAEYPVLCNNLDGTLNQDMIDLLKFGVLVHDIGKIKEMKFGVYQPCSIVTHRYIGIEMMPKDKIIEAYGEEWWLQLVSIFLQHHGEFGDECRTIASYLVHKCDLLESQLTSIGQALEAPVPSTAGDKIKQDGLWLAI